MLAVAKMPIPAIILQELSAIKAQLSRQALGWLNESLLSAVNQILDDPETDYNLAEVRRLIITAKAWLYGVTYFIASTSMAQGHFFQFCRTEDGALVIKFEDGAPQHDALAVLRDAEKAKAFTFELERMLVSTIRINTIPADGG